MTAKKESAPDPKPVPHDPESIKVEHDPKDPNSPTFVQPLAPVPPVTN